MQLDFSQLETIINKKYYPNLWNSDRYFVMVGSAGSGKSWFAAQKLCYRTFKEDVGHRFLVLRRYSPGLETSAYRLIKDTLSNWGLLQYCHVTVKPMNITNKLNGNEILFRGMDDLEKVKCYSEDTEILTQNGWSGVRDIKVGDSVATYDYDKDRGIFQPVTKKFEYDYKGKMVIPKSATGKSRPYIDFCVTPNHNMLGKRKIHTTLGSRDKLIYKDSDYEFHRADSLPPVFKIPRTAQWDGKRIRYFEIPLVLNNAYKKPVRFKIKPFLRFLGWYLSEGNINADNRYGIIISQQQENHRKTIIQDIKNIGYTPWSGVTSIALSGKNLWSYLKQFGNSYTKFIPRWILDLHPDLLRHLFDTLIDGDGHIAKTGRITYSSSSKQLADDVAELAIKLGYRVGGRVVKTTHADSHMVYINKDRPDTLLTHTEEIDYDGKIYCFEVPPFHTVLMRRNGHVMWCGQSIENITGIWYEESTEAGYDDIMQLDLRLRPTFKLSAQQRLELKNGVDPSEIGNYAQFMYSYNPISKENWTYKENHNPEKLSYRKKIVTEIEYNGKKHIVSGFKTVLHSTYKDNAFLDLNYVASLEALINKDEAYYKIYCLGEYADLKNKIFNNYKIIHEIPDLEWDKIYYGLDFGFVHPTALVKVYQKDDENGQPKSIYIEQLFHESKTTTADLIEWMNEKKISYNLTMWCDNAEPDRIQELQNAGYSARGCYKARNYVIDSIDFMKMLKIFLLDRDTKLKSEFYGYRFKEDKDHNVKEEPIDVKDDGIKATIYGTYTEYVQGNKTPKVRYLDKVF